MVKRGFQKIFGPIASRLGFEQVGAATDRYATYSDHNKTTLLNTFYDTIKAVRFIPSHIVDIGANKGTWTREALLNFPKCKFTLLEPQSWLKNSINDLLDSSADVTFHALGAGNKKGSFKFTILERDDSCSFKFSEEEAKDRGYSQIDVPVVTINDFIAEQHLPVPDIIKIDAEGLDMEVLQGASDFFGKTEVFLVEAGVANKGFKNSFLEITKFMDEAGYRLFDITDMNRPFDIKILWLVELVFVKKDGVIDSFNWVPNSN